MKKMKQVLFLLLAGLMVLGLTGTAMAENDYKVMVNGEYVTFTDAQPQNVDGRIMVPFRAILETLGADVTWDQAAKTITAVKDDIEISFVIGENTVNVKQGDRESIVIMDVVPFVSAEARTYVGTRFMAEAFGYTVGWDAAEQTAVIADFDSVFAGADEEMALLSKCLQANNADMKGTYKTTADFDLAVAVEDEAEPVAFRVKGNMAGFANDQMDADITLKMALEAENEEMQKEMQEALGDMSNITMKIKMNGKTGDTYTNTNLFTALGLDENTWLKQNVFAVYEEMGIDLKSLMTIGKKDMAASMKDALTKEMTVDTYDQLVFAYALLKDLFGNEQFTAKEEGSKVVYTNTIGGMDVLNALLKNADLKDMLEGLTSDAEIKNILNGVKVELTVTETGGKISETGLTVAVDTEEVKLNLTNATKQLDSDLHFDIAVPELFNADMNMKAKVTQTSSKVNTALPTGAVVVDEAELSSIEMVEEPIPEEVEAPAEPTAEEPENAEEPAPEAA